MKGGWINMSSQTQTGFARKTIARVFGEARNFSCVLFKNPFFLAMSAVFIIGKIAANLYMGAKISTSLRSGILGFILYMLGCYCIHIFTVHVGSHQSDESGKKPYAVIGWVIIIGGILLLSILRNVGVISCEIPLWGALNTNWINLVNGLVQRYEWIEGTGFIGWPYLILYVLIPFIIALYYRMKLPKLTGWKNGMAAIPFILLYLVGFILVKGISVKSVLTLLAVMIWPAFGEEFLYRGILQQAFLDIVKKPITAIVLTSVLFATSHIPIYVFAASGTVVLSWSALLPIMLVSFFWGYGYYRTGSLWPWIFIHAVSNLVAM